MITIKFLLYFVIYYFNNTLKAITNTNIYHIFIIYMILQCVFVLFTLVILHEALLRVIYLLISYIRYWLL